MGWRSIILSRAGWLSLHDGQLRLEQADQVIQLPLEDLAVLILETPQATLTSALLSALASYDVAVLTCDEKHLPNGVLLPFLPHSRCVQVLQRQLALGEVGRKRAWQQIVQQKIRNQATVLGWHYPAAGDWLEKQAARVKSGDSDNRESQAAQHYFTRLFGPTFTRGQTVWANAALDYGYAVLRAAIARSLVVHGFLPALGLHHCSQLNAFNLADDLIEPFRPLVDDFVMRQPGLLADGDLLPRHKQALVQLLYREVQMASGTMQVLTAIDRMVHSLGRYVAVAGKGGTIECPQLLPVPDDE